jgi:CDGSH-type Zn-finger protein/truncated hemoglobin YjbI
VTTTGEQPPSESAGAGRGPLARMLETRGGRAAPEAPFVIEHREALIYMLCEAAELEHGIMCQYLFAAFSLKQREDEGLSPEQVAAATRWRHVIGHVASEEMLHLSLVHNLLSAIGGPPHFERPNLPQPARHYPAGVVLALLPFGEQALQHFMFLERPEGMELDDAKGFVGVDRSEPLVAEGDIVPQPQDFATVGHLYRSIEAGFAQLAEKFGEQALFVGPPRAQATTADFGWPELVSVTDLASAQAAIDTILEQGEGARGAWEHSHFGQFVDILEDFRRMTAADPTFDPVRPVRAANVRPTERGTDVAVIADPLTARCVDVFNVAYEILLQILSRYFAHTEETDAQLSTLATGSLDLMVRVLRPLGELITTLPVGPDDPGRTAGPSFELFYETDYLMPHRAAAWALLEERLRGAATFCATVCVGAGPAVTETLTSVDAVFNDVADTLAAHFSDWGAHSRFPPRRVEVGGDEAAASSAALIAAAAALARSVSTVAADRDTDEMAAAKALFADALAVVNAIAAASPGVIVGAPDPDAQLPLAQRLLASVLRPIAAALTTADPAPAAQGVRSPAATRPDVVKPQDADAGSPVDIDARRWALATASTELYVELAAAVRPGASGITAAVGEAAAALQDIAVSYGTADSLTSRATRTDQLREMMASLGAGIRISINGPYLVTNAESLTDWLGNPLPLRPQMALCRCGQSAIKPLCDGTHATSGFTDQKDPHRVPDQRDTYSAPTATVFDNRGICQHSGLCTDRLSGVFHAGGQPFVTAGGGRLDDLMRAVRSCPSGALSVAIDGREAREQVDRVRPAAIEVSRDGPYRVTGALPVTDEHGGDVERAEGASREHFALCRCGQSQNKPFCSGMHYYVGFTDPAASAQPTIFEWVGGMPALNALTALFHEEYIPGDPDLATVLSQQSADRPARDAAWLAEVFGGPAHYTAHFAQGPDMFAALRTEGITEQLRARWVNLLVQASNDIGLPADPQFRTAFRAYLERDSRVAREEDTPGPTQIQNRPVPRWDWTTPAGPPTFEKPTPDPDEATRPTTRPGPDDVVDFIAHIKPLFRERDRRSMLFMFDLWSEAAVREHAGDVLARLRDGTMPCDGAWDKEDIDLFARWSAPEAIKEAAGR